jgi:ABC-2 type transport system permease protein
MRTVLIIAGKDLLLAWRDRLGFFWWLITFPLLIAVLVGAIFTGLVKGPSKPTAAAVVDLANNADSRALIETLTAGGAVHLTPMSLQQAQDAVRRGTLSVFLQLGQGFHVSPGLLFGDPLPVALGVDPSRTATAAYFEAAVYDAAGTVLRQRWLRPEQRSVLVEEWIRQKRGTLSAPERTSISIALAVMDRLIQSGPATRPAGTRAMAGRLELVPLSREVAPQSSFEICFPLGIIWGLLGLAAEFAMANVRDRETGTLLRLRIAPIRRSQILVGNGIAAFTACIGVMAFLLTIGRFLFGVRVQDPAVLAMVVACIALCFVGVTMLLSVLGKTESAVGGAAWAFLLVMAMLGGGMVPDMFLPPWMDVAGHLSFVKWAIRGLEGAIWRGFSIREALLPCAALLLSGGVCAAIGLVAGTRGER